MIPDRLLTQTVTWVQPGRRTDTWGNAGQVDWDTATRTDITCWLTQTSATETVSGDRDVSVGQWELATNELSIGAIDRIEVGGVTYEVTGTPNVAARPSGPSHLVVQLTRTDG